MKVSCVGIRKGCRRSVGSGAYRPAQVSLALLKRLENPSVGNGAAARLPTARDEELGRLLGGAGLGAQELQQFGVDFLCMRPRDAVRTTLDNHEARA
jgi:hypothetical protein